MCRTSSHGHVSMLSKMEQRVRVGALVRGGVGLEGLLREATGLSEGLWLWVHGGGGKREQLVRSRPFPRAHCMQACIGGACPR